MKILLLGEVGIGEAMAGNVVQLIGPDRTKMFRYFKTGVEELTCLNLYKKIDTTRPLRAAQTTLWV